jgi:photosystem II stability/assembly factor-like uncharacterized protein
MATNKMIIPKYYFIFLLSFIALAIFCSAIQLNAQSRLVQLGPDYLTSASDAYFGDNGRIFLSTTTGLYFSDEDKSWHKVNEDFNTIYFNRISFTKSKDGRVYIWNKDQLWFTTDNGETWHRWFIFFEPVPFADVNSLAVQGDTVFVALKGGLGYATNNGSLAKPFSNFNGKNIVRVVVNGNSILSIGSDSKTYLSTDRGVTWNIHTDLPYFHGEEPLVRFDNKGKFLITADNSTIWSSSDFGKTWTIKDSGLVTNPQIYLGGLKIDGDEVFAVAPPYLYKSTLDALGEWESIYTDSNFNNISIQGNNIILTGYGTLINSTDRGLTWTNPSISGIHDCRFEYLYSNKSDGSIIAYGGSGMFKKSNVSRFNFFLPIYNQALIEENQIYSGGAVVVTRSAINGSLLNSSPIIPDTFIFSSGDEVCKVNDSFFSLLPSKGIWELSNQDTWMEFNNGLIPNAVKNLQCNENYLFSIVNNSDLFRSPTSEPNWIKMNIATDFVAAKYVVNGPNVLVGGTSSNCYLSRDSGDSWNRIGESVLNGAISALYLDDDYLLTTTYQSKYLYASKDKGETWIKVSLIDSLKYSLFVESIIIANDSVYLGTNGNGIISLAQNLLNRANQSITFNPIEDKTFGDPPFTLNATASSSQSVEYSTTSDKITINGDQVTLVKPGTASVIAMQPGNDEFAEADQVLRTFCVNPSKPTVTTSRTDSGTITLVSNAKSGNQWYLNDMAIVGATADQITVIDAGVYTVRVTLDNCTSQSSIEQPIVITSNLSLDQPAGGIVYPNPANEYVNVNLQAFDRSRDVEIIIYHAVGGLMARVIELGHESTTVSVYGFPAGLYIVKVQQHGISQTGKFLRE